MSYLEPILVHPVRRQNFGDTVAQKCNPYLIRCRIPLKYDALIPANKSFNHMEIVDFWIILCHQSKSSKPK